MKFIPHGYQKYAIDFIVKNPIVAALLDMGLGKTVIALTAIYIMLRDSFAIRRVLIVAPLRVARDTWPNELKKWDHLSELTYSVAIGTEAQRKAALSKQADITIINRECLAWLVEQSQFPFNYDMVVVDEMSSFKNHKSKRFKALMKVRPKVKRIVGLTGTPSSNSLIDLYGQFRLLDMGARLGRYIGQYRANYFTPDKVNGAIIYSYKPRENAEKQIYDKISDITISMKATDYIKMPKLITSDYPVYLSAEERKRYASLKRELVLQLPDGEVTAANAAALTNKLCQMANGAVYTDDTSFREIHSQKLDALEDDIIQSMNGRPLLIAYWFKHDAERIKKRFNAPDLKTPKEIHEWNEGKIPVALIHPASAGHGLNLQKGGNTLVWYGLTWSLELYQQTIARLYRQGQTSDTVVVRHLVAKGTIDEQILKALSRKDRTQSALIEAVKAEIKQY